MVWWRVQQGSIYNCFQSKNTWPEDQSYNIYKLSKYNFCIRDQELLINTGAHDKSKCFWQAFLNSDFLIMAKVTKVSLGGRKWDKLEKSRSSKENMLFPRGLPSWALTELPSFQYKMLSDQKENASQNALCSVNAYLCNSSSIVILCHPLLTSLFEFQ